MASFEKEHQSKRREAILSLLAEAEASGSIPPQALVGLTFQAPNHLGEITDHVIYKTPDSNGFDYDDKDDGF